MLRSAGAFIVVLLLSGCNLVVLEPAGDIARQQGQLIIYATVLMLIVILPVMALTIFFAIRYRASNESASYSPDWDHSISLEMVVWSLPLAIIICLAGLTWVATHRLEPYNELTRIDASRPLDPAVEPLTIQVVALDWKWLFIYPEQDVATVNEVAAIVDRPVEFKLTSATVMNSFYVPALAGQIYAMAGMETELNAVINEPGDFEGFSANYSGNGFSQMRFRFHGLDATGFDRWVADVRAQGSRLDRERYRSLALPSVGNAVTYFDGVEAELWDRIINLCVEPGTLCHDDMMMVDALGGGGLEGLYNREIFAGICASDDALGLYYLLRPEFSRRSPELAAALGTAALPSIVPTTGTRRDESAR
ncbi:MAG: ubiquinol oxidase subunit II [Pseudomonadota bacterium]